MRLCVCACVLWCGDPITSYITWWHSLVLTTNSPVGFATRLAFNTAKNRIVPQHRCVVRWWWNDAFGRTYLKILQHNCDCTGVWFVQKIGRTVWPAINCPIVWEEVFSTVPRRNATILVAHARGKSCATPQCTYVGPTDMFCVCSIWCFVRVSLSYRVWSGTPHLDRIFLFNNNQTKSLAIQLVSSPICRSSGQHSVKTTCWLVNKLSNGLNRGAVNMGIR